MTELLLSMPTPHEGTYEKIAPSLYYNTQSCSFHRLSFLPNTVLFQNQQVSKPHFATLTHYDPYFHLINLLLKRNTPRQDLPAHFKHLNLDLIADLRLEAGKEVYHNNKTKIYDYLEKKVQRLEKCLADKLGEKSLEVDKNMIEEKSIREETVVILKSEIEDKQFVDAFAKERYNYENIRKLIPYNDVQEETMAKKKNAAKKQPKKEEKRLEHGQKTLFSFMGKK